MSTIHADSGLLYDAIVVPRGDRAVVIAFAASLVLHAAAIVLWPALRVPQPQTDLLTVELQRLLTPPADTRKKATARKPGRTQPTPTVEHNFERQELEPVPMPSALPQPMPVVRKEDVAAVVRPEPIIKREPTAPQPVPVMRTQPRPSAELPAVQQPLVERDPVVAEPSRPEPTIERRIEVRPEPGVEARVEPRLETAEPRPLPKIEQRVEPVATPRPEAIPQRQQVLAVAPEPQRLDAVSVPRVEALAAVPRVERHPDVKPQARAEPTIAAPSQPAAETTRPQLEQIAPQLPAQRTEQPNVDPRREIKPQVATQAVQAPRAQPRQELARNDIQPVIPTAPVVPQPQQIAPQLLVQRSAQPNVDPRRGITPQVTPQPLQPPRAQSQQELAGNEIQPAIPAAPVVPQQNAPVVPQQSMERRVEPMLTAPTAPQPDIPRQTRPAPPTETRAPIPIQTLPSLIAGPKHDRPQTPPKISVPNVAAVIPTAPRHNKVDQEEAIRRFALEVSRRMERRVSERDYPRVARDHRWQGTTELVLRIHADGKLGAVSVAASSGYEILDQRAIDLVNKLKLPSVPEEVEAQTFSVRIPVKFALKE